MDHGRSIRSPGIVACGPVVREAASGGLGGWRLANAPDISDNRRMPRPEPGDFGLTETTIEEIRARDQKQTRLFVDVLLRGCAVVWLVLTVLVYASSARRSPLLGLLVAPLLGGLGAVISGLPMAILSGAVAWLAYPRHPKASALERYEAATVGIHVCDVCRLAQGDSTPREGVIYCGRCGAWVCPACRNRYDLRAIAALKRAAERGTGGAGPGGGPASGPGGGAE